jgi:branched-chain amino acid transport system ATP-binding protein
MADTLLKVDGINVYYGNIHAVKDISFTVNAGEIVTLIGANGAGKSTTLKTISGLLKPRTGDVLYKGKSIKGVRAHKIVESGLAQVPEGRHVFLHMTVDENLDMGAYTQPASTIAANKEKVFTLFPEGAPQAAGGHHVRRRAADAGHGACAYEQRFHADAGRAFHGSFAAAGAGDL